MPPISSDAGDSANISQGTLSASTTIVDADTQDTSTEGGQQEAFGQVDGHTFQTQEDFQKWVQDGRPELDADPKADEASKDDIAAKDTSTEEAKPKEAKAASTRTDDEIRTSLKEAGGFYADAKYEPAAFEFEKTGTVSPATIKSTAEAFGVPEDMVQKFIDGQIAIRDGAASQATAATAAQAAQVQAIVTRMETAAGGKEAYDKFVTWGKTNLSDAEAKAYDTALDKDPDTAAVLLDNFLAKYRADGNGSPRDITKREGGDKAIGDTQVSSSKGYGSSAEQTKDMQDPRYQKGDKAWHAHVQARTAATTAF